MFLVLEGKVSIQVYQIGEHREDLTTVLIFIHGLVSLLVVGRKQEATKVQAVAGVCESQEWLNHTYFVT